jgi:hypothetical protein
MEEVPAATAVTRPELDTVATAVLLLVHVIVRPVSTVPSASRSVALSCTVEAITIEGDCGATVTVATGFGSPGKPPPLVSVMFVR